MSIPNPTTGATRADRNQTREKAAANAGAFIVAPDTEDCADTRRLSYLPHLRGSEADQAAARQVLAAALTTRGSVVIVDEFAQERHVHFE